MAQIAVDTVVGQVLQICRECPMQTIISAYVAAARRFCDHSRWLLQNVAGVTENGTAVYVLDLAATGDLSNEVIGIQAMELHENSSSINVLTESFSGGWDPNPISAGASTGNAVPQFYQYVPMGKVALSRTSNGVYTFLATVVLQPKLGSVSVEDTLVGVWSHALDAGALSYLLALPRTPWIDVPEARQQGNVFKGFMNQAASSVMRGYNAGAQTTDRHGRTSGSLRTRMLVI